MEEERGRLFLHFACFFICLFRNLRVGGLKEDFRGSKVGSGVVSTTPQFSGVKSSASNKPGKLCAVR